MKILRIIARLNVGGPARHVVWLTDALNDEEFESVLVAGTVPPGEEDMGYFAEQHGVKPLFIEEMSRELSPKDVISLWKVWRTVLREKPDIIHTHTAKAGTIGRAAGFLYRWLTPRTLIGRPRSVKLVHTYHGHIFHSYYGKAKTRFFLFIERALARLATDRIIAITGQQRKEIHEEFGVGRSDQFEVVPLGIDLSVFENADSRRGILREEIGAADEDIVVGIVGRLTEIKDHGLFLEAVKEFSHEFQELHENNHREHGEAQRKEGKIRFVIIGDGHLRGELETLVEELGLSDRVTFLGNREDPDVFYAGLDIVALTSRNEGTPLSLIEALASRRPVVSTAVGGVVDLLGNDVGAGLVPARGLEEDNHGEHGGAQRETGRESSSQIGTPSASEGQNRRPETEDKRPLGDGGADNHREHRGAQSELAGESSVSPPLTVHRSPIAICERGIAVTSRDPSDFAEAIRLLAKDRQLQDRLVDSGYQFVKRKYDKARLIEDIRKLYRELKIDN